MSQSARKSAKKQSAEKQSAKPPENQSAKPAESAKSPSAGRKPGPRSRTLPLTLLVVALAAVAALGAVSVLSDSGGGADRAAGDAGAADVDGEQPEPDAELLALARRDTSDQYALGAADAPVVMIEYSDFQCPFCGKFARDTKPGLVEKYVEEGVLRIEWRQFPIFGKESENAARGSYAAGRQGRFWEFHDVAFGEERKKNSGAFARDRVERMAAEAGVKDLDRFARDMKSEAATAALRKDLNEGYALGVSSTPAFLVNGTPVLGAQSADYFAAAVERARQQAARTSPTGPADESAR